MSENGPALSFLMICYKQERYIAEALTSALNQDYENLEIVVSDDHSPDRTYEIACEIAATYHGPHKIILNRNEKNLGIGGNFHKAYTLSHGEWLVMAAGDDVSYPNRCRLLCECIQTAPPDVMGICTTREIIDGEGHSCGYDWWRKAAYGASTAWQRKLFADFPPFPPGIMYEDAFLTFRLFYAGFRLLQASRPTMQYRVDGISVTSRGQNTAVETQRKVLVMVERLNTLLAGVEAEMHDSTAVVPSRERWQEHLAELRQALQNRKETANMALTVMDRSLLANLGYLLKGNAVAGHRTFRQRLGWMMRSKSAGYAWWCDRKVKAGRGGEKFAPVLPDTLADAIMDVDEFLKGDFPVSF